MMYVTCTDKFMSGWGLAAGKINKLVLECDTEETAQKVATNLRRRPEMTHVRINFTMPTYNENEVYVSYYKQKDGNSFPLFYGDNP